jgi:hypothetical protein
MFKTIRDFVEAPIFVVSCDESCGQYFTAPFQPGANEDQQQAVFVSIAMQKGWKISFDRQMCPLHVQKAAQDQKLIVLPTISLLKN